MDHGSGSPPPDVAIVGAGIIGCAIARELADAGARVCLLDRGDAGAEASSAAAGMLGPQAECDAPGPLFQLGVASLALYPAVAAALHEETGIDPGYRDGGILLVALDEEEAAVLERRRTWQVAAGLAVERVDPPAVRELAPGVTRDVHGALLFPHDHRVDNVELTRAYAAACRRRGVQLRTGVRVRAIVTDGGRVRGVRTDGGLVEADRVVLAAGAWAAELAPPGGRVPVRPIRGQMLALRAAARPWRYALYSHGVYLVPRRDGRVLAGSTYEDVGFDKRVTASALAGILGRTLRLAPGLADATFHAAWAGLRPLSADGLPLLGPDPVHAGLFYASGHYRNGILLAPVTARTLVEAMLGRPSTIDRTACDPARFAGALRAEVP